MCGLWFAVQLVQAQSSPPQDDRGVRLGAPKRKPERNKKPLDPAARPELILQTGHSQKVDAIAFSPDGRYLATGGEDKTIKLWEAATGRELRTLSGNTSVKALAFNHDGQWLAASGNDGRIRLWQTATGQEAANWPGHAKTVNALAFNRDGTLLASGGADFKVKVWDVTARRERFSVEHYGWVSAIVFSPDGRTLASGGADKLVKLWDLAAGRELMTLDESTAWVRSLAFSPDGSLLAAGGDEAKARIWRVAKGKLQRTIATQTGKQTGKLLAVSFTPDGAQLLTCAADHTIKRFDANGGAELQTLPEAENLSKYETAVFSPDGQSLASCSGERETTLRRVAPASGTQTLESRAIAVNAVAFSADGRWLATGQQDYTVTLWDIFAGRAVALLTDHAGSITALAFSPDSQTLAVGSKGGAIKLWDVLAARARQGWTAHSDGVNALVFTRDGAQLCSGSVDHTIKLWDAATKTELAKLTGHTNEVTALSLSLDGLTLASASVDQTIKLWDLANKTARTLSGHAGGVFAVAFSTDGKQLASGGDDQTVKLWDAATGQLKHTLSNQQGRVYSVAFTPDGQLLASGGASGEVKIWETATGQQKFQLRGHTSGVNAVNIDPAGRWLATAGADGSTRFWELATGELAATLLALRNSREWLVVTPDGLFDGSPAAWSQILWRFGRNTFNTAPVELFFNEFYFPDLLAEILAGKKPRATADISQLDRRQPRVNLQIADKETVDSRTFIIKLAVAEAPPDAEQKAGSGAQDVRLFRNGSLVKVWRGDVLKGAQAITLECTLPLVAGENRLTAYAFNRDDIKSGDDTRVVIGAPALQRRGTLYLLAIGVNEYANADYNLRYAVNDARAVTAELQRRQVQLDRFAKVVTVTLLDNQATKANIRAALARLAGKTDAPLPELAQLQAAQPEDAVIIFFAGHGTAQDDRFYLLPHDLGYAGRRAELDEIGLYLMLASSVSDVELEALLADVDAGQLLFVLDACNSGQALEAEEKRRGPMNSRGLAQLAYEKGMNILTASQSYQLAQETSALQHGYLSYALIEEGLKKFAADAQPRDGQISVREWLDHATQEVPRLQEAKHAADRKRGVRLQREAQRTPDWQRPRVFYRREPEGQPFLVAKEMN